jgi:hypothetical protein
MGKLRQVSSLVASLPSSQQPKFDLFFFFDLVVTFFDFATSSVYRLGSR